MQRFIGVKSTHTSEHDCFHENYEDPASLFQFTEFYFFRKFSHTLSWIRLAFPV